jgi:hypothetical protein
MRKHSLAVLVVTSPLGLSLTGCQDTKTRHDNEKLKVQRASAQLENSQLLTQPD